MIKMMADSLSGEGPLPGLYIVAFSLCLQRVEGLGSSVGSFIRALIPYMGAPLS